MRTNHVEKRFNVFLQFTSKGSARRNADISDNPVVFHVWSSVVESHKHVVLAIFALYRVQIEFFTKDALYIAYSLANFYV